jgi:hypothetical protein
LREGNARFVSGDVTHRDHRAQGGTRHWASGPRPWCCRAWTRAFP